MSGGSLQFYRALIENTVVVEDLIFSVRCFFVSLISFGPLAADVAQKLLFTLRDDVDRLFIIGCAPYILGIAGRYARSGRLLFLFFLFGGLSSRLLVVFLVVFLFVIPV